MRLTVVIVSYNVYPFLDNCLRSIRQAMAGIEGEIIVVDNASVDGTPQHLQEHYPDVTLISNRENIGFAKANNQGIRIARGEFILLLNPDTVVSEDTFTQCISFMDNHPKTGAIGVKMLDGSGLYLPESKRGLPTLTASFMKMTGFYRLFPRSRKWNSYYQGHVDKNETAEVEVLCGAFMFIRKQALDKAGLLDEDFFMYGEDIDLSYRITQAGYLIHYLPTTNIIHYKGESTKKSTLNYVLTFYQAMLIFTHKHPEFSGQQFLIKLAIYFHGLLQLIRQNITRWWPVIMDALLLYVSFFTTSKLWSWYYFDTPGYFHPTSYYFNLPLYTGLIILAMYLNGAYDKPYKRKASWIGFSTGLVMILVLYALLPTDLRSSRMVIFLGSLLFAVLLWFTRTGVPPWGSRWRNADEQKSRKAIIVAGQEETARIKELINRSKDQIDIIGIVTPEEQSTDAPTGYLGHIGQLQEVVRIYQVGEIIFSAQDVPFSVFTSTMSQLGPALRYMLAASTTMNIVGSMGKDIAGESYAIQIHFNLSDPASLRAKRIFDLVASVLLLLLFPVLVFFLPGPFQLLRHIFKVLFGKMTWVSYYPMEGIGRSLPPLPPGVLDPGSADDHADPGRRLQHIYYVYARDYHWTTDLSVLIAQIKKTGQTR